VVALEFLTILRVRQPALVHDGTFGQAQALFPAVGLLLGGLLAGADWAIRDQVGPQLTGWLLAGLLLILTGGLHADGLADSFDGLFGGRTPERRLEIMRDSAIGSYGALALIVVTALKATAFAQLESAHRAEVLVLTPALARWACVAAIAGFPYARPSGAGVAFHAASWPWAAPLAAVIALAAAAAGMGAAGAAGWGLALAAGVGIGAYIAPRLGGLTGDTYGAIVEISEVALLLAAIAWFAA
jgi:adenosylcobinamide-GDP ribazoletransferase